jgi:hypothetical protein
MARLAVAAARARNGRVPVVVVVVVASDFERFEACKLALNSGWRRGRHLVRASGGGRLWRVFVEHGK